MNPKQFSYSWLAFLLLLNYANCANKRDDNENYEELLDETSAKTATRTATNRSALSSTAASYADDEYYDDEDYANQAQSSSSSSSSNDQASNPPYTCPLQCKCDFKPQSKFIESKASSISKTSDDSSSKLSNDYYQDDEDDDAYDKKRRNKRSAVVKDSNSSDYDEYDDDEYTNSDRSSNSRQTIKKKYDIYIDCSKQALSSISNLFDYDFPLDQIVSFNLSYNNFRFLKLDDGFEDLINIRAFDFSGNSQLRTLSPRNFLKKFRHLEKIYLNNLNQIDCKELNAYKAHESSILNKPLPIDCKWYKSLLYLDRKNVQMIVEKPQNCDLKEYLSTNTISLFIMSKCFSNDVLMTSDYEANAASRVKNATQSSSTVIEIDQQNKYEFKIEPDMNQILIEGDTLELICRLKKLNYPSQLQMNPTFVRSKMALFFRSQLKWYINSTQILASSSASTATRIQFVENKARLKNNDFMYESKLIVSSTAFAQHSGKYYCTSTLFYDNIKNRVVNTTHIDIKILNKNDLKIGHKVVGGKVADRTGENENEKRAKIFCPEIITQTYKGIYKWPITMSNTNITQKCLYAPINLAQSTSSNKPLNDTLTFECLSSGEWSSKVDFSNCLFESNLTRFLLTVNSNIFKSNLITVDDFIHKFVKIQTNSNGNESPSSNEINMYDILHIQKYLHDTRPQLNNLTTTWKYQLLWLNDAFTKLNRHFFDRAQLIDFKLFSSYFFDTLLQSITSTSSNLNSLNDNATLLSTSLAHLNLMDQHLECKLNKYELTQQIYFLCDAFTRQNSRTTGTKIFIEHTNKRIQFVLFDNDKLFPYKSSTKFYNYDLISLINVNQIVDIYLNTSSASSQTNAQILCLKSEHSAQVEFNLSLEIKFPQKLNQLLKLIDLTLKNSSIQNSTAIKKQRQSEQNLFDQIFYKSSDNLLLQLLINNQSKLNENLLLTNLNMLLNDEAYFLSSIRHFSKQIQAYMIKNTRKFNEFRQLIQAHLNPSQYEIVYGEMDENSTLRWTNKPKSAEFTCNLTDLEHLYAKSSLQIFSNIRCALNQTSTNTYKFISLRLKQNENLSSQINNSVTEMIEQYARIYRLNSQQTLDYLLDNYVPFRFSVVYFFSCVACVIFIIQIVLYLLFRRRLMMPRSFFHVYINKWLCLMLLLSLYILGIRQVFLPHICFTSSISIHYFLLCTLAWYMLSFYSFYTKLNRCKIRNYEIIFNPKNLEVFREQKRKEMEAKKRQEKKGKDEKKEEKEEEDGIDDDDDEDYESEVRDNEYMKKPVVYLYMIGYGIPLLLCSIVVSIAQRDYIQLPYAHCFTNNSSILVTTLFVPLSIFLGLIFVFIVMILFSLRRILNDLETDRAQEDEKIDYNEDHYNNKDLENVNLNENKLSQQMLNVKDKVERWKNCYDQLKPHDLLELKANRLDKVSNVSTTSSTSSFFDKNRSLLSDQTSIMDSQYSPNIQLKYSIFSLLLFLLICTNATFLLVTMSNDAAKYSEFMVQMMHYMLSILVFILSFSELAFYVLSRSDLMILYDRDAKSLNYFSDSSDTSNKDENVLYFSPKMNENHSVGQAMTMNKQNEDKCDNNTNRNYVSDTVSSSSSSDNDVLNKKSLSDALFLSNSKNIDESHRDKFPSLAVQEETGSLIYNQLPSGVPKPVERRAVKKQTSDSSHTITSSSLYGSATQTLQSLTQTVILEENRVYASRAEEKEPESFAKNCTFTSSTRSKSKFNELLNNKCAQHAGAAIESIFAAKTVSSSLSSSSSSSSKNSSSHAVDSVISSTDTGLTAESNKDNQQTGTANSSASNSNNNIYVSSLSNRNAATLINHQTSDCIYSGSKLPQAKPTRIYGSANSNYNSPLNSSRAQARTSTLFRPREIEPKVETSV